MIPCGIVIGDKVFEDLFDVLGGGPGAIAVKSLHDLGASVQILARADVLVLIRDAQRITQVVYRLKVQPRVGQNGRGGSFFLVLHQECQRVEIAGGVVYQVFLKTAVFMIGADGGKVLEHVSEEKLGQRAVAGDGIGEVILFSHRVEQGKAESQAVVE